MFFLFFYLFFLSGFFTLLKINYLFSYNIADITQLYCLTLYRHQNFYGHFFGRAKLKLKVQIAEDVSNHSIKKKLNFLFLLSFFAFLFFAPSRHFSHRKTAQFSNYCRPPGKKVPTVTNSSHLKKFAPSGGSH